VCVCVCFLFVCLFVCLFWPRSCLDVWTHERMESYLFCRENIFVAHFHFLQLFSNPNGS
jgi:hypothetical protein